MFKDRFSRAKSSASLSAESVDKVVLKVTITSEHTMHNVLRTTVETSDMTVSAYAYTSQIDSIPSVAMQALSVMSCTFAVLQFLSNEKLSHVFYRLIYTIDRWKEMNSKIYIWDSSNILA